MEKLKYTDDYLDPKGEEIAPKRGFWAIYISDESSMFSNSLETEVIAHSRTVHKTFLEAPSSYLPRGRAEGNVPIEIGIKFCKVPFIPSVIKITFSRMDIDTYQKLTWSKSYRMRQRLGVDFELFVPMSKIEINRYEVDGFGNLAEHKIKRPLFFGLNVDSLKSGSVLIKYSSIKL